MLTSCLNSSVSSPPKFTAIDIRVVAEGWCNLYRIEQFAVNEFFAIDDMRCKERRKRNIGSITSKREPDFSQTSFSAATLAATVPQGPR
ncbi:hypothetical protein OK016_17110 [Vibrio chagasii]|nr:hypothetical protein [Vibrio chagasii]